MVLTQWINNSSFGTKLAWNFYFVFLSERKIYFVVKVEEAVVNRAGVRGFVHGSDPQEDRQWTPLRCKEWNLPSPASFMPTTRVSGRQDNAIQTKSNPTVWQLPLHLPMAALLRNCVQRMFRPPMHSQVEPSVLIEHVSVIYGITNINSKKKYICGYHLATLPARQYFLTEENSSQGIKSY